MSDFEHGCQFCYYEYFDSRAYPCSMCIYGEERKDKFQPKGKQNKRVDKDTNVRNKYDCKTCRYESLASYEGACDDCTDISGSPNNYEPKTEPQTLTAEEKAELLDAIGGGEFFPKDEPQIIACPIIENDAWIYEDEPQTDEEYINNLPWTEAGNGEQTDIEIARAIVHKAIDDAAIAEDAYPDLRQKMHDAVDNYEPQTERSE